MSVFGVEETQISPEFCVVSNLFRGVETRQDSAACASLPSNSIVKEQTSDRSSSHPVKAGFRQRGSLWGGPSREPHKIERSKARRGRRGSCVLRTRRNKYDWAVGVNGHFAEPRKNFHGPVVIGPFGPQTPVFRGFSSRFAGLWITLNPAPTAGTRGFTIAVSHQSARFVSHPKACSRRVGLCDCAY